MVLETPRLLLRPFTDADAPDLYASACDRRVGHSAGWEPHKSVEESLEIIRTVFSEPNSFAVVDKETGRIIGSAAFNGGHQSLLPGPDDDIGYALHPGYWGRGLMTEAVRELLRYGFEELGLPSGAGILGTTTAPAGSLRNADSSTASPTGCGWRWWGRSWRSFTTP